ncbi:hypothetical protein [Fimbriiglobus ruber]|uniref:hypothetical protein n=1 Tax=Fimbriiglobus ruber TaxID=1908690 RepID=UPI0018792830|nr:hypothetical protein [Fimbriiglobus ruber]
MICLMHEGSPYGYLKVGDKVILPANLARIVGASLAEVDGWLTELQEAGVFSRDTAGCIFSRRMIKDEFIRESRASGGKLGGNPLLKDKAKISDKVNLPSNLPPTPPSASSSTARIEDDDSGASEKTPFERVYDFGCSLFPQLATQTTSVIHQWLDGGADIDLDIIPEIKRLHDKGIQPRGWGLFTQDIANAKSKRETPLPKGETKHARPTTKQGRFEQQDYYSGTEGFEVIGGPGVTV